MAEINTPWATGNSWDELVEHVVEVREVIKNARWTYGDAAILCIVMFNGDHESVGKLAAATGVSKRELLRAARVAASFPPDGEIRDRFDLSYQHYATVAGEPDAVQLLEMAQDENMTQYKLARIVKGLPELAVVNPDSPHTCAVCGLLHGGAE